MKTTNNYGSPIGTIVMWGGFADIVPDGWLVCDGRICEQSTYNALYKVIGHNFGTTEPSQDYDPLTQFYIPDLRGRFIRGTDDENSARDPDRNQRIDMQSGLKYQGVGSIQADQFRSHTHQYQGLVENGPICDGDYWTFGQLSTAAAGGNETRPINVYLYFIIKAE